MALTLGDNFSYGGSKPLDARLTYATLAEMKAVPDSTMYNGCMAYCVATDKTYQWKSSNTVDPDTGRWREFQTGSTIVVDDEISSSSKNPVQNKVIKNALDGKVNTVNGKGLSTNDYTTAEKTKLAGLSNYDDTEVRELIAEKQDELTAGVNITFNGNTINAPLPIIANQFDKANLYSATEKVVGCWTDGRPIYQKVISCGALPNATTKNVAHGISNLKFVVNAFGYAKRSVSGTDTYISIPWVLAQKDPVEGYPSLQPQVGMTITDTNISISCYSDRSAFTESYIAVQYTKTTDAANSFNYADENDYSTSEKIVGTWIDGSKVYQKTINVGNFPNATTKNVAHGISNLSLVIDLKASMSSNIMMPYTPPKNSTNDWNAQISATSTNLVITTAADWSTRAGYITLKYTKTTG